MRSWKTILLAVLLAIPLALSAGGTTQAATGDPVHTTVASTACGLGMGVAFDGQNLWFSCDSNPDLFRADPVTGAVSVSYTSGSGSGAIAYDGVHNGLWTSVGFGSSVPGIQFVQLDAGKNPVSVTPAFDPGLGGLIDGIAYDAADNTLYISEDGAQVISHYTTSGAFLDARNWAQFGTCQNSGLAIGGNGLFQGANGCTHVWVTDKVTNAPLFDFDTSAGGGRDEGLSCDPLTFAPTEVMWSRDAFNNSATAFEIPAGTCGVGGGSTGIPVVKTPRLSNLWLCQPVATCADPETGIGGVQLDVDLGGPVTSVSPKGELQTIGSFEFEVRYDRKLVSVQVNPGDLFGDEVLRSDVSCATTAGQGFVQFRCNVKGKAGIPITGPGTLAEVVVRPTADVYSMVIPSQENGIATQLINQGCELSDLQGHPIATSLCDDADVTLRYLEGDMNADCVVDVRDQQETAFRWNSHTGQLLYNSRFDLEPAAPKLGDGDIDAHDLQVVYGRHGSTCTDPHPAQPPVDPKGTPPSTPTPPPV
jgi:hypothetical protein